MARPVSWLPRLKDIRRTVAESVRSHYTRKDLERLFEVQPATALRYMQALPTTKLNNSLVVERAALDSFLREVQESDDVSWILDSWRTKKTAPSRRALRSLVRRDLPPVAVTGVPSNLTIERGRMAVTFATLDQLVETLFIVAQMLNDDTDEFSRLYEPVRTQKENTDAAEVKQLFADLEERERRAAAKRPPCSAAPAHASQSHVSLH